MSTSTTSQMFTDVSPTLTASVVQSYRPPLATGTGGAVPANTATATHYAYGDPNPTTPAFIDSYQWINTYLVIHKMSTTSYRYAYLLWLVITLFTVIVAVAHLSNRTTVASVIWRKFTIRRRTWRKQASLRRIEKSKQPHRQPYSLPSNAQLFALVLLFAAAALLCCIGPDYVSPYTKLWDMKSNLTAPALARREISEALEAWREFDRRAPIASTPTTRQPEYTIPKAWWTAGGRTGIIAFALFPLCVLFALKAPPIALFALPFTTQMHFDKLSFLHRWSGRIIWAITTIHVGLWGVQLGRDQRHGINEGIAWDYVWLYPLFIYGVIGYICMTLLVFLSLSPLRTRFYETFYVLHVVLVFLTIVFSALHFPQIWHWCWTALGLWGAERLWRWGRGVWVNGALGPWGSFGTHAAGSSHSSIAEKKPASENWEMGVRNGEGKHEHNSGPASSSASTIHEDKDKNPSSRNELAHYFTPAHHDNDSVDIAGAKQRPWSMTSDGSVGPVGRTSIAELIPRAAGAQDSYGPVKGAGISPSKPLFQRQLNPEGHHREHGVLPPPGFAHCVILPGRTVRLTLVTARPMKWAPGQHVLLCVPGVSKYTTHPFTIAGACDASATGVGARGREIVLVIRARAGFTRSLWEEVARGCNHLQRSKDGRRGTLMRATVDGPFGSSVREKWDKYETALLIAGGSGVAFALSVLEGLCLSIVEGRAGTATKRIRFVWMIREYAHVQWCAAILRRCREMVPNRDTLQIDIFVTNFSSQPPADPALAPAAEDGSLAPPTPRFLRDGRTNSVVSTDSLESSLTTASLADYDYSDGGRGGSSKQPEPVDGPEGDLGTHVLDYTNFDGEEDTRTAAETQLSKRVKREGRQRRARSRKIEAAVTAKLALEEKRKSVKGFFGFGSGAGSGADEPLAAPMPRYAHAHDNGSASGSNTPLSASPAGTPRWPHSPLMTPTLPTANLTDSPTFRPPLLPGDPTYRSSVADSMFSRGSVFDDSRSAFGGMDEGVLEMDDDEAEDVNIVAEMARPGKPKLPRILADEVERAGGEIIVACCGPTSLNAAMRKFVADQIDIGKVWRGDMSGAIKLVSEDYEW